jgi:REP element-mobilizing transposase RayT
MRPLRWIIPHHPEGKKPTIYHCISRVVDRRLVFGPDEKEKVRTFMRMQENFSGNRILAYCFMSNHFHLLLEVTPPPPSGLSDSELLNRLRAIYTEPQVSTVEKELAEARRSISNSNATQELAEKIHERFTYRMHNLSEFMKGFLQRYTQWHNAKFERSGHLWEDRFKSIIVEDGIATKAIAAYIDLNPVRAGLVKNPAEYRWSSYGEAIGGGSKGNGKTARAGLVRALRAHKGTAADPSLWLHDVAKEYRKLLLLATGEISHSPQNPSIAITKQNPVDQPSSTSSKTSQLNHKHQPGEEIPFAELLSHRVKFFTSAAMIGSKDFINLMFRPNRAYSSKNPASPTPKPPTSESSVNELI